MTARRKSRSETALPSNRGLPLSEPLCTVKVVRKRYSLKTGTCAVVLNAPPCIVSVAVKPDDASSVQGATEGGDHNDTTFQTNFANARNHGFIRGAYHFYIPGTDALKQADFFIRTVKLDSGDLPPVLDVEVTGRKEKKELQQGIKRWLDRIESHYGVKPILYTSYPYASGRKRWFPAECHHE